MTTTSDHDLFHISDRDDIERFVPRVAPTDPNGRLVVWAVDGAHLGHYLLPRDCPRVCFRAGPDSSQADIDELLDGDATARVVAIEAGWIDRVATTNLSRYRLPPATFELIDTTAGYFVSTETVAPIDVVALSDLPGELAAAGYTLRVLPSLWDLRERVIVSSLPFSIIRWRYAQACARDPDR